MADLPIYSQTQVRIATTTTDFVDVVKKTGAKLLVEDAGLVVGSTGFTIANLVNGDVRAGHALQVADPSTSTPATQSGVASIYASTGDVLNVKFGSGNVFVLNSTAGGGGGITVTSASRTAGNLGPSGSTNWASISTALDLTIAASAGDVLEVQMSGFVDMSAGFIGIEAFTITSTGGRNNALTSTGFGTQAWAQPGTNEGFNDNNLSGGTVYTVASTDISGGNVKLRPFYRQGTSGAWTLRASASQPFRWWVKNLG